MAPIRSPPLNVKALSDSLSGVDALRTVDNSGYVGLTRVYESAVLNFLFKAFVLSIRAEQEHILQRLS